MRKIIVSVPTLPTVAKIVLLDRPGILYINTACTAQNGIILIVPAA